MSITSIRPLSSVDAVIPVNSDLIPRGLTRQPVYAPINEVKSDSSRNHLERSVRYWLNQAYINQGRDVSKTTKPVYPETKAAISVLNSRAQISSDSSKSLSTNSGTVSSVLTMLSGANSLDKFKAQHQIFDEDIIVLPRNRSSIIFGRSSGLNPWQRRLLQGWRGKHLNNNIGEEAFDKPKNINQFDSSETGEISNFRITPVGDANAVGEPTLLGARPIGAR